MSKYDEYILVLNNKPVIANQHLRELIYCAGATFSTVTKNLNLDDEDSKILSREDRSNLRNQNVGHPHVEQALKAAPLRIWYVGGLEKLYHGITTTISNKRALAHLISDCNEILNRTTISADERPDDDSETVNQSVEPDSYTDSHESVGSLELIDERTIFDKHFGLYGAVENPLFLAKDVAEWIDYAKTGNGAYNVSAMLSTIENGEKLVSTILVSGQNREMWFLTEDGLYEVLFQSRKPIAKQFKAKVKEILKELRLKAPQVEQSDKAELVITQLVEHPIEYKGKRVITTKQLAQVYETDVKNIRDNFANNNKHFTEGRHYFRLEGAELADFKNSADNFGAVEKGARELLLWTHKGAVQHCKCITTYKAWGMFNELTDVYFAVKEAAESGDIVSQNILLQAKVTAIQRKSDAEAEAIKRESDAKAEALLIEARAKADSERYTGASRAVGNMAYTFQFIGMSPEQQQNTIANSEPARILGMSIYSQQVFTATPE